jgi:hypothetical protein
LGGWAEGFLAEDWDVIGYDIERHEYGDQKYPGTLILKDVLDITAAEIRALNPRVIVASPPCTEPSYRAMPWSRAKALNSKPPSTFICLFYACFKLAHDAGVPVIVENVRGALPWVGPAAWNFGSFYLWGDVPALMPITMKRGIMKPGITHRSDGSSNFHCEKGIPHSPMNHWTNPSENGTKQGGDWFNNKEPSISRLYGSKSPKRKAASSMIAKIPFPLASHIARSFLP